MDQENKHDIALEKQQRQLETLAQELPEQYELLDRVSEGGMGAIFKARNRYTNSPYAIKVLHQEFNNDEKIHKRFFLEAKVASSLNHPHICKFQDFGITASGTPYLVMEWINGISLQNKVSRDGPLLADEAVTIFMQIAAALEHAHANKLVHRDLKPDNIMLSRRNRDDHIIVHIVDFGIAKLTIDEQNASLSKGLTQTGMIVGTPLYMSPEQARAGDVDKRSDIYSMGCLMYFTLSGQPPFLGNSVLDTMYQHINKEVPRFNAKLEVPDNLGLIIYKAMEKAPQDRYQDMETLARDLRKLNRGITIEHAPLAKDRAKQRKQLMWSAYFIFGFLVMYALSIGIQNLLNSIDKTASETATPVQAANQSTAPGSKNATKSKNNNNSSKKSEHR
jgi:serine/threonine-protein kinase